MIYGDEEILAVGKAITEIGLTGARRRRGVVGPGEIRWEDWPGFEITVVMTVEMMINYSWRKGKRW